MVILETYATPKGDETGTKADAVEARAIVAATMNFILNGMAECRRLFCCTTITEKSDEQRTTVDEFVVEKRRAYVL